VNVGQGLNWISQTFGPNGFKTKQGRTSMKGGICKYINKLGVEYKEHVAGHVRAWEGEELS